MWSVHVCVSFNHPYTTGESIQKQDPKIEESVWLTALPPWVVCSPEIPGKAALGATHPPHSWLQLTPKENLRYIHITIYVLKAPHSTVRLPPNRRCSETTLRFGSAGCAGLLVRNSWEDQLPLVCKAQAWLPARIKAWHVNIEILTLSLATFLLPWDFQLRKLFFTSALKTCRVQ